MRGNTKNSTDFTSFNTDFGMLDFWQIFGKNLENSNSGFHATNAAQKSGG
jgi:hypothetical protein